MFKKLFEKENKVVSKFKLFTLVFLVLLVAAAVVITVCQAVSKRAFNYEYEYAGGCEFSVQIAADLKDKATFNKYAGEKIRGYKISACTDITGFGLLAHALEMASDNSIMIYSSEIPYFEEAYLYADEFLLTAAGQRNRSHLAGKADVSGLPFAIQELLFDPQTSGGLLICADSGQSDDLLSAIQADDPMARIIGEIVKREKDVIIFQ